LVIIYLWYVLLGTESFILITKKLVLADNVQKLGSLDLKQSPVSCKGLLFPCTVSNFNLMLGGSDMGL